RGKNPISPVWNVTRRIAERCKPTSMKPGRNIIPRTCSSCTCTRGSPAGACTSTATLILGVTPYLDDWMLWSSQRIQQDSAQGTHEDARQSSGSVSPTELAANLCV